jgi:hypothetical protein
MAVPQPAHPDHRCVQVLIQCTGQSRPGLLDCGRGCQRGHHLGQHLLSTGEPILDHHKRRDMPPGRGPAAGTRSVACLSARRQAGHRGRLLGDERFLRSAPRGTACPSFVSIQAITRLVRARRGQRLERHRRRWKRRQRRRRARGRESPARGRSRVPPRRPTDRPHGSAPRIGPTDRPHGSAPRIGNACSTSMNSAGCGGRVSPRQVSRGAGRAR